MTELNPNFWYELALIFCGFLMGIFIYWAFGLEFDCEIIKEAEEPKPFDEDFHPEPSILTEVDT